MDGEQRGVHSSSTYRLMVGGHFLLDVITTPVNIPNETH